jgi:uncharacterized protein (DUF342 family)
MAEKIAMNIKIAKNAQEAELVLQKPEGDCPPPSYEDMLEAINKAGVSMGVKDEALRDLSQAPVYDRALVIAAGKKPGTGSDGVLNYLIRTDTSLKPTLREDGTADYKSLEFVNAVEKGQRLVEIIPPGIGQAGFDVKGNDIPGLPGNAAAIPQCSGTEVSEDGRYLIASTSGNAEVTGQNITVHEVLKTGNVDNSTGDIVFPGDIIINGDVAAGFSVRSTGGSITVKGTVDAASLEASGDILICEGINGAGRGVVSAGGDVRAKYFQSCAIKAGKNLYTDTVMNCHLECDGDVELTGKRSQLIGGHSYITGMLRAKVIGCDSYATTSIKMCAAPIALKSAQDKLLKEIEEVDKEIVRIVQELGQFDRLQKQGKLTQGHVAEIQKIQKEYKDLKEKKSAAAVKIEKTKKTLLNIGTSQSIITCSGTVNAGVKFTFGPLTYNVTHSFSHSRVLVLDGEIKVSPI